MTDRPLVHNQSRISWSAWLREHGGKLILFARQQTRSYADAEDVLQDALVKLAKKVADGSFEGGQDSWVPYVYTSIRRCAIDLGRKEDRRTLREEKVESDRMAETGGQTDPWFEQDSADGDSRMILQAAVKQLPKKFSDVITLKVWGDRTFSEIASILDESQNTVASRYRYGLEALKKNLHEAKLQGDI